MRVVGTIHHPNRTRNDRVTSRERNRRPRLTGLCVKAESQVPKKKLEKVTVQQHARALERERERARRAPPVSPRSERFERERIWRIAARTARSRGCTASRCTDSPGCAVTRPPLLRSARPARDRSESSLERRPTPRTRRSPHARPASRESLALSRALESCVCHAGAHVVLLLSPHAHTRESAFSLSLSLPLSHVAIGFVGVFAILRG